MGLGSHAQDRPEVREEWWRYYVVVLGSVSTHVRVLLWDPTGGDFNSKELWNPHSHRRHFGVLTTAM